ncbi:Hypothetical predicted protein [Octopus vulgaris]|uniref:Uncharacterized protein n=1 Tax=Octopus vulgaris TaxID=6645 RepID=A0AA36BE78_OCTVU|nr:Hypothetical predicted protein [Octopus vulgaris]
MAIVRKHLYSPYHYKIRSSVIITVVGDEIAPGGSTSCVAFAVAATVGLTVTIASIFVATIGNTIHIVVLILVEVFLQLSLSVVGDRKALKVIRVIPIVASRFSPTADATLLRSLLGCGSNSVSRILYE